MQDPVRCFIGFDPRQPLAYNVLQSSIHRHSGSRVLIEPLILEKLPITRRGLTEFTYSRFLVPWLCDYQGSAIFMDADIVVTGDVGDLLEQSDGKSSVQVMQSQPKFEWASVMLFNNAYCEKLSPAYVDNQTNDLLSLNWGSVGHISKDWNYCVGYADEADGATARLFHYTQGLPCWFETEDSEHGQVWLREREQMLQTCDWASLMARSVHAQPVIKRMLKRYGISVA